MDKENDVLNIDLPEYEESSFPFPDVKAEGSFEENKDDIYRRNMIIAAMEAKEARPVVRREKYPENFGTKEIFLRDKILSSDIRREKRSRHGVLSFLMEHSRELKLFYLIAMAVIVTIMMVMLVLAFQIRGRTKTPELQIILPQATGAAVTEIVITEQYEEVVTEVIPEDFSITLTEVSVLS